MGLPILTQRLRLRDFQPSDFEAVHAYASDPEVTRYMAWGPNDEADTCAFLERCVAGGARTPRAEWELAIAARADGALVGGCGVYARRAHYAEWELGYCLRRASWGQGVASEAVRALLDFAFRELEAHRVYATVDPRNAASRRLAERLGLRREGLLRRDTLVRGQWRDSLVYAVLDEEWSAARSALDPSGPGQVGSLRPPSERSDR